MIIFRSVRIAPGFGSLPGMIMHSARIFPFRSVRGWLLALGIGAQSLAGETAAPNVSHLVDDDDGGLSLARRWHHGDAIPGILLEWRRRYPRHFLIPSDTMFLYQKIDNYPLLEEIIFLPAVDERVFDCAVKSALKLGGLHHFYSDFHARYDREPGLKSQPRFQRIAAWSRVRQVAFSALSLGEDMPEKEREKMRRQIVGELGRGGPFDEVSRKYTALAKYYPLEISNGRTAPVVRTHVGIRHDYAIYSINRDDSFREPVELPPGHADVLLGGTSGQVLILSDHASKLTLIYKIHEIYLPEEDRGLSRTKG